MSTDPRIEEPSCLAFSRQDIRAGKASPVIRGLVDIIDSQKRRLDALAAADKAATITTAEGLLDTRAGLALANAAFNEGLSSGIRACNESGPGVPFVKPASPYYAPLFKMIRATE